VFTFDFNCLKNNELNGEHLVMSLP